MKMEWVGGNGHLKDSGGDLSDILVNKDGGGVFRAMLVTRRLGAKITYKSQGLERLFSQ